MNILEFAINMELDGEKYYTEQAEINKDNFLKTVFLMLATDERTHAKILQNKSSQLNYDLRQNEMLSQTKNVFNNLPDIKNEIKQIANQLDTYRLALKNEKESISLYQKLLSDAMDDESKRLFKYLLQQEENHYEIIDQLIILINHSEEWVEAAEFGLRKEY